MDQYDLNQIFKSFDSELKRRRMQFKANDFALLSIDRDGVCLFQHSVSGLKMHFDAVKRLIAKWE